MKIYYISLCAATAALLVLSAPVVFAEEKEPEEMVVSASRTAMDLSKVSSSVTIIDREFIEQRQQVYIVDILRDAPGLTVNRSGSAGGFTEVRSRGGEANQLLVLVDGIRANDPANGDQFQWQTLTSYDVERVEVVRGPQSAVWGSDANTGVINIITRREQDQVSGGAFVEGGSYDSLGGGLRIGGNTDSWSWGVNGSYVEQDGFNIARQGDEDDPFDNKTVGANLGYRFSDTAKLGLLGRYTEADTGTDPQTCTPVPGNDPCTEVVTDALPDATASDQLYAGLSGEIGFVDNRWTHQLLLGLTQTETSFVSSLYNDSSSDGKLREARYQTNWDFARGGVARGTDLVTFAIDYQRRDYSNSEGTDADNTVTGYVLEGRTLLADALSLTGSVRYDDNSDFKNVTTWRFTAGYDFVATGTRLRGAAGTGQKAPTMTELFGYSGIFVGNPDLQPESSKGWEVGVDQSFQDDAYRLSLTYFDERLEDQIVSVFPPPDYTGTALNADGTTKRKGVEVGMTGRFTEQFTGKLSYTYLDSDAVELLGTTVVGRSREIRRPRNTAALNLNYGFLQRRANVNLNFSYTDKQEDNKFLQYSGPPYFGADRTELDSFTLVDLTGDFKATKSITLYGRIDNLFDEDYEELFSYNTMGRAAFVGARVSLSR